MKVDLKKDVSKPCHSKPTARRVGILYSNICWLFYSYPGDFNACIQQ